MLRLRPYDWHQSLSLPLAELIGAFIGDGFSGCYRSGFMTQFTGDATLDKEYFTTFLIPALKASGPQINPRLRVIHNVLRLTVYSRDFHDFFVKRLGFNSGKKGESAVIPKEVLSSGQDIVCACIRGVFDTDGTIYFDKRSVYHKPYPRIELHMRSEILLIQIRTFLESLHIIARVNDNNNRLQINGFKNCRSFVYKVGFTNKRHKDKLAVLF